MVKTPDIDTVWEWLDQVPDPEIPVISLVDLGIVRDVAYQGDRLRITLSPTYSGCPATRVIEEDVRTAMRDRGIEQVIINQQISPPWTTDWMSAEGKEKLRAYGIAPPESKSADKRTLFGKEETVRCPHCRSLETEVVSMFGSTACKALYRCKDCLEPFDYFKCI